LYIDTGPGLNIEESHVIEMETRVNISQSSAEMTNSNGTQKDCSSASKKEFQQLKLQDGRIEFPAWASDVNSVLWIPVRAISDRLPRGSSSGDNNDLQLFVESINFCMYTFCCIR
jgi:hypothetical protein